MSVELARAFLAEGNGFYRLEDRKRVTEDVRQLATAYLALDAELEALDERAGRWADEVERLRERAEDMNMRVAREDFQQLYDCAGMLVAGIIDNDWPRIHYGLQGTEFAVLRAAWWLGKEDDLKALHNQIGDHSPDYCPVCQNDPIPNLAKAVERRPGGDPVVTETPRKAARAHEH